MDIRKKVRRNTNYEIRKDIRKLRKFEWKHRNLMIFFLSIVLAYFILRSELMLVFIQNLGKLGYFAVFVLGILFTYALTALPATAVLYDLGHTLNPFLIAFIGAFGSVIGNYMIFHFVKNKLIREIKLLSKEINMLTKPVSSLVLHEEIRIVIWKRVSRSKIWKTLIPIMAGLIIASPLPDEIGAALFGAARYDTKKFLVYSYILHFIGILVVASFGKIF